MTEFIYMHPEYVSAPEAKISVRTHGFNYGTSVFEGIRAYWDSANEKLLVFRLADHYLRLIQSAKLLHMHLPLELDGLVTVTRELLRRNRYTEDVYVRPIGYKGVPSRLGVAMSDAPDEFCIYTMPLGKYLSTERPLRVRVASWHRVPDNAIPARAKIGGSYVNPALSKTEALMDGYDECLMLSHRGTLAEGSTENLFAVFNGQLTTPPVHEDLLVGITRRTIIDLAETELGLQVCQRLFARSELYNADEIFLCGTGAEIAGIGELDRRPVGDGGIGPVTRQLQTLYFAAVHGELDRYRHWCTEV